MKFLSVLLACGLLTSTRLTFNRTVHVPAAGCEVLSAGETDQIVGDVALYASVTSSSLRLSHGVPAFPPDSAQFYNVASACDSAEVTYRAWRVSQGDPNVVIPLAFIRWGSTKMFLGTALIGRDGYGREYAVYDSVFTVKHVFSYR